MSCRDTLSLSTDQEPRGSLCKTTSSIQYGRREATLFQRNPCHHSCDTFSKLSRSALPLSFNLPRLSQINLISMPSMEFVTWLMCFYVELPKHSWQQCFPRWQMMMSDSDPTGLRSRWQHSMAGELSAVCRLKAPGSTWYTSQGADTKIIIDTNSDPKS